jgi:hypothetical protein
VDSSGIALAPCPIATPNRGSGAAAPFLWIETARGNVEVWALGEDRFRITAPGREQLVTGFQEAQRAADALAERRGRTPLPRSRYPVAPSESR